MASAAIVGALVAHLDDGTLRPMTSAIALMGGLALAAFMLLVSRRRVV
jgi:hypothetical protein